MGPPHLGVDKARGQSRGTEIMIKVYTGIRIYSTGNSYPLRTAEDKSFGQMRPPLTDAGMREKTRRDDPAGGHEDIR